MVVSNPLRQSTRLPWVQTVDPSFVPEDSLLCLRSDGLEGRKSSVQKWQILECMVTQCSESGCSLVGAGLGLEVLWWVSPQRRAAAAVFAVGTPADGLLSAELLPTALKNAAPSVPVTA